MCVRESVYVLLSLDVKSTMVSSWVSLRLFLLCLVVVFWDQSFVAVCLSIYGSLSLSIILSFILYEQHSNRGHSLS